MCIDYWGLMPLLMRCNTGKKLQHEAERLHTELLQDCRRSAHTGESTPSRITKYSSSASVWIYILSGSRLLYSHSSRNWWAQSWEPQTGRQMDQNIVCGCGVSGLTLKGAQSRATYGASSVHWELLWARPTVRRHWKHLRIPREEQDNSWLPYLPRRHTRNTLK